MSIYSDINTSKPEKFPIVTDIDSVWQAFENFMKTNKGERFFRPMIGSPLRKTVLFELDYEDAIIYDRAFYVSGGAFSGIAAQVSCRLCDRCQEHSLFQICFTI